MAATVAARERRVRRSADSLGTGYSAAMMRASAWNRCARHAGFCDLCGIAAGDSALQERCRRRPVHRHARVTSSLLLFPKVLFDNPIRLPFVWLTCSIRQINPWRRLVLPRQFQRVADARLPLPHQLPQASGVFCISRAVDEAGLLVRIGLQVEQLEMADLRIRDQFEQLAPVAVRVPPSRGQRRSRG
jgi:hypothetical protein